MSHELGARGDTQDDIRGGMSDAVSSWGICGGERAVDIFLYSRTTSSGGGYCGGRGMNGCCATGSGAVSETTAFGGGYGGGWGFGGCGATDNCMLCWSTVFGGGHCGGGGLGGSGFSAWGHCMVSCKMTLGGGYRGGRGFGFRCAAENGRRASSASADRAYCGAGAIQAVFASGGLSVGRMEYSGVITRLLARGNFTGLRTARGLASRGVRRQPWDRLLDLRVAVGKGREFFVVRAPMTALGSRVRLAVLPRAVRGSSSDCRGETQ